MCGGAVPHRQHVLTWWVIRARPWRGGPRTPIATCGPQGGRSEALPTFT